ncbi:methylphosphotriester-DNA--protein-cysteine methyltransferase family protein [Paenibacillus rhizovicinus]|uniref:Methylphosphotriester-DNA--protein-cysteine methyltransferase family protein n=1 Tax=Paenibacillus rhizovicinus TaxID=2704463 RepID=A0A6C0P871_9BACL|nr:Ada metal-binding domain-containing protein [Paenibacillus rhizovicinus]QHW34591.1 methylphosphotriester-DNA--protein-cysteine methyltransferase family protein [Paenibacillus rhizovicinus]
MVTEDKWSAIVNCDAGQDGRFYYSVSTTGIFCRPSCKSRAPKREHVRVFATASEAAMAGFRPCKRCKPDGLRLPDEEWVDAIAESIRAQYRERLTLPALADQQHVSQFHLQRTFKRMMGLSPADYLLQVRLGAAKALLRDTRFAVAEVGEQVGMPNAAHFATVFHRATGRTPSRFREEHTNKPMNPNRKVGEQDE